MSMSIGLVLVFIFDLFNKNNDNIYTGNLQVTKFHFSIFLKNTKRTLSTDDELNNINIFLESNIKKTISQNYDNIQSKELLIADLRQENIQVKQGIANANKIPNKYNILKNFLLNEKSNGKFSIINHICR